MLMVQPRNKDMEEWSKEQIQPTIDGNPILAALVAPQKTGSSGNVIDNKEYPGGPLRLRASNSPDGFRRYSARVAMNDEVDAYPLVAGKEGDVIGLIYSRVQDAWNYIVANGSTPTEADISRIDKLANASSLGYPFLTCPHCGEPHIRLFESEDGPIELRGVEQPISHLVWDPGSPETARYVCPACGVEITQRHHIDMLSKCFWIGENWEYRNREYTFLPGFDGRIAFSTWAGYVVSPNTTPAKLVARYERDKGNPETLKTFVNTVKGRAWAEPGEELRADDLYKRREEYPAEVPAGAVYLSAGVDVQGNRWEMEVVGWGPGEESWSVDYQIIPGDPSQDDDWWELFRPYLMDTYRHESGVDMPIIAIGIDHGFLGKRVESFIKRFNKPDCWAFKGMSSEGRPLIESGNQRKKRLRMKRSNKFRPELIGDHEAKLTTIKRLKTDLGKPGHCHFPIDRDRSWFDQVTAEKLVTRYKGGRAYREWILLQERNEALDCRKMAYAAMLIAAPDLSKTVKPKDAQPKSDKRKTIKIGRGRRGLVS